MIECYLLNVNYLKNKNKLDHHDPCARHLNSQRKELNSRCKGKEKIMIATQTIKTEAILLAKN